MICDTTSNTDIIRRFECLYYLNIFFIWIIINLNLIRCFVSKEQPQSYCLLVKLCYERDMMMCYDLEKDFKRYAMYDTRSNDLELFWFDHWFYYILWSLSIILFYVFYYLIWLKNGEVVVLIQNFKLVQRCFVSTAVDVRPSVCLYPHSMLPIAVANILILFTNLNFKYVRLTRNALKSFMPSLTSFQFFFPFCFYFSLYLLRKRLLKLCF